MRNKHSDLIIIWKWHARIYWTVKSCCL